MGRRDDIHALSRRAARQHGNITRRQLLADGMTAKRIAHAADQGWLIRRHTGVYAVGHVPDTRASRWAAAVLAMGDDAVLSHRAAAAHWEILRGGVPTEVTVPTRAGLARRDGVVVHRIPLSQRQVGVRRGIPVTTLVQTILDAAAVLPTRRLHGVFEEAQVRYRLRPELLAAEALSRHGHRGNGRIRTVLEGAIDPREVRSILELRFLRMCDAYGLPRPMVNETIGPWMPDFLWPVDRLVVETDGERFHRTAAKRRRDAEKDAFMRERGLTVVRLTWADVTERPALTAHRVRASLRPGR